MEKLNQVTTPVGKQGGGTCSPTALLAQNSPICCFLEITGTDATTSPLSHYVEVYVHLTKILYLEKRSRSCFLKTIKALIYEIQPISLTNDKNNNKTHLQSGIIPPFFHPPSCSCWSRRSTD